LGGIETGAAQITIPAETAFAAMRRDLALLCRWFAEAQL
jgi:hypothetical protein